MSEEIESSGGIGLLVYFALAGVLISLFYYFCLTPRPRKSNNILCGERRSEYLHQSVEVRKEKDGEGLVRRVYNAPKTGDLPAIIIAKESKSTLTTQYESFEHGVRTYGKSYHCMGTREYITPTKRGKYIWKNYIEVAELRDAFGRGLVGLGLQPGDRVGIFSKNREEWIISEQACYAHSFVIVSFYDTLGPDAVEFIAGHCEAKVVICANENLKDMMKVVHNCPKLSHIIHFDKFKSDEEIPSEWKKIEMRSFGDLIKFGRRKEIVNDQKYAHHPPSPDDLSTIMYTSGTTGAPKGVLLTHANIVSMMNAANIRVEDLVHAGDCYLSYLPLAHILERMVTSMAIFRGVAVGLYSGDTRVLKSDLMELRPTLFCGVPRVFERIFDEIQRTVSGGTPLRKFLFGRAIKAAARARKEGTEPPLLWQVLVLNKLKKVLGGRVRLMLSGGAPLSPNIHEFLITAFQTPIIQAYGLTETCAGATIAFPKDTQGSIGHVGAPVHCCEVKLVDVSEMGYTSADDPCPRGEVLLKGPHVSAGYYKDVGKTQESFRDGWFYTGDIGRWNEDGTMSIIDRKKNIFKLSHGEYVAAEKLEGVYANCDLVSQIWVYGDSEKSALVAVVVPKEGKVKGKLEDAKTREQVLSALNKVGDENKVRGFEKLFGVWLTDEEFTDKNDLATPTLKLKRHELKKKFEKEIASMYEDIAKKGEAGSGTRRN